MDVSVGVGLGVLLVAAVAVMSSLRSQDARGGAATALRRVTVVCVVALVAARS